MNEHLAVIVDVHAHFVSQAPLEEALLRPSFLSVKVFRENGGIRFAFAGKDAKQPVPTGMSDRAAPEMARRPRHRQAGGRRLARYVRLRLASFRPGCGLSLKRACPRRDGDHEEARNLKRRLLYRTVRNGAHAGRGRYRRPFSNSETCRLRKITAAGVFVAETKMGCSCSRHRRGVGIPSHGSRVSAFGRFFASGVIWTQGGCRGAEFRHPCQRRISRACCRCVDAARNRSCPGRLGDT
jgi:hypothetical protein